MSASSIHALVQSLEAKKAGSSWMALCPAHDDRNRSLAIRGEHDGRALVHCHAGCRQADVIAALRGRGLRPDAHPAPGSARDDRGPIVAEYFYRDESGRILYRITRHVPKAFCAWRPDGHGGWLSGIKGIRRVPYNLPELIASQIVFVVEGEKDCNSLRDYGFVATTSVFGAGKWDHTFDPLFAGKTVVLIPDADDVGQDHMRDVARGVLPHAAALYQLDLDDPKDISAWLEAGHSEVELCRTLEGLFEGTHD